METVLEIGIGALIAGAVAYFWRNSSKLAQKRVHAVYLFLAALIYVGFAFRAPNNNWLLLEIAGLIGYGAIGLYGLKRSPMFLAYGWGAHVLWDVVLHWNETAMTFVPHWYAPVCIGYDLAIAGYLGYVFTESNY